MKIATVVGARPQFIKCAAVSRVLRNIAREVLIHTGQHYDDNMSGTFFRELQIPTPEYNLGIGSGAQGVQTGEMLKKIEDVLLREKPDYLLVYGDTNSTLAGALAAVKLHIPIAHVEAGLRSFNRRMPEEWNRMLTDRMSALLFCPTETAVKNLAQEGMIAGVNLVGDVMLDALLFNSSVKRNKSTILTDLGLLPGKYILATVHRAENTDDPIALRNILEAFAELTRRGEMVVFAVHPRTRNHISGSGKARSGIRYIDPLPYLDMLMLEKDAKLILTDSGGVQKEAFWFGVPCITLRNETEWVETVESGWNILAGTETQRIVHSVFHPPRDLKAKRWSLSRKKHESAAEKIVHVLTQQCSRKRSFVPMLHR